MLYEAVWYRAGLKTLTPAGSSSASPRSQKALKALKALNSVLEHKGTVCSSVQAASSSRSF